MNLTSLAKIFTSRKARRIEAWTDASGDIQMRQLRWLLFRGATTRFGEVRDFERILRNPDPRRPFAELIPAADYEDFRPWVMRMVDGEKDVLWPGKCRNFAQSSGTSGGRSKFVPVTADSLRINHYGGSSDVVIQYLRCFPESRLLSGKAMILGGSFESKLKSSDPSIRIGDLSATLIDSIPSLVNLFRIPDKKTALLSDWNVKLDALAQAAVRERNVTNISGVPSWFLRVILRAIDIAGVEKLSDVWPNLEVFFHGGISFEPYREQYKSLTDPEKMHFFETYNASEGFFATQAARENDGLLLLIDRGIYYEFLPLGKSIEDAVGIEDVTVGSIYEMIISSCNGLWRYRIGDTVEIVSKNPVKIRIAGRTKSYINAFGEELMEDNAERAIAAAAKATGAVIHNYTAGPLYAHDRERGRHQWTIEWDKAPTDIDRFGSILDAELQKLNSDYAAKRKDGIFLAPPEIISLPRGTFDAWLRHQGNGKLGGQRKIPRLRNDRQILDHILSQ